MKEVSGQVEQQRFRVEWKSLSINEGCFRVKNLGKVLRFLKMKSQWKKGQLCSYATKTRTALQLQLHFLKGHKANIFIPMTAALLDSQHTGDWLQLKLFSHQKVLTSGSHGWLQSFAGQHDTVHARPDPVKRFSLHLLKWNVSRCLQKSMI